MNIKLRNNRSDSLGEGVFGLVQFLARLKEAGTVDVNVDLSELTFVHPLYLTALSAFAARYPSTSFSGTERLRSYLETVRFPMGIENHDELEAWIKVRNINSRSYFPIVRFPTGQDGVSSQMREHMLSEFTAFLGSRVVESDVLKAVRHSFSELCDNIVEHAMSSEGFLMAQAYPSKGLIELCIVDSGQGIMDSYHRAGIGVSDHVDAINRVVEAVSSKDRPNNERGFGIKTSRRMTLALNGDYFLYSGDALLHNEQNILRLTGSWPGTICAFQVSLNRPKQFDFYSMLEG